MLSGQPLNLVSVVDMLSTRPQLLLINLALLAPFGPFLRLRWPAVGLRGVTLVSLDSLSPARRLSSSIRCEGATSTTFC